jgi:hypothetical protein
VIVAYFKVPSRLPSEEKNEISTRYSRITSIRFLSFCITTFCEAHHLLRQVQITRDELSNSSTHRDSANDNSYSDSQ